MDQNRFQLSFSNPPHPSPILLGDEILSLGSCFAQRVGASLESLRFPITLNPFGISFDALTIARQLEYLSGKELSKDHFQHLGLWRHFDFHGSISHVNKDVLLNQLQESIDKGRRAFHKSRVLILTFGTAYYFTHIAGRRDVANCHKIPGTQFERKLAGMDEMFDSLSKTIKQFLEQGEDRQVILSVSPVRHLSDGLAENNRSKARLLELCHSLAESEHNATYFPSYEYLMDVLRDYRFYAEDMIHPSEQSVSLILQEFVDSHFHDSLKMVFQEMKKLQSLENHKILHPETDQARAHQIKTEHTLNNLKVKYPQLLWK